MFLVHGCTSAHDTLYDLRIAQLSSSLQAAPKNLNAPCEQQLQHQCAIWEDQISSGNFHGGQHSYFIVYFIHTPSSVVSQGKNIQRGVSVTSCKFLASRSGQQPQTIWAKLLTNRQKKVPEADDSATNHTPKHQSTCLSTWLSLFTWALSFAPAVQVDLGSHWLGEEHSTGGPHGNSALALRHLLASRWKGKRDKRTRFLTAHMAEDVGCFEETFCCSLDHFYRWTMSSKADSKECC